RVHRPPHARPPLVGRPAPGGRGEGRPQDPARDPYVRDDHDPELLPHVRQARGHEDRKSTRLNSSHVSISYAVFCLKKKTQTGAPPGPYSRPIAPERARASAGRQRSTRLPALSGRTTARTVRPPASTGAGLCGRTAL